MYRFFMDSIKDARIQGCLGSPSGRVSRWTLGGGLEELANSGRKRNEQISRRRMGGSSIYLSYHKRKMKINHFKDVLIKQKSCVISAAETHFSGRNPIYCHFLPNSGKENGERLKMRERRDRRK